MKKNTFNLTLLTGIFCLGLITSNLFGGKLISVLGLTVAGAIVTYPLTFLTTDIIGEIWGKQEANDCVRHNRSSRLFDIRVFIIENTDIIANNSFARVFDSGIKSRNKNDVRKPRSICSKSDNGCYFISLVKE